MTDTIMADTDMTDAENYAAGMKALQKALGLIGAERFIAQTLRERFDYTEWRQDLFEDLTPEELDRQAMEYQRKHYGHTPKNPGSRAANPAQVLEAVP